MFDDKILQLRQAVGDDLGEEIDLRSPKTSSIKKRNSSRKDLTIIVDQITEPEILLNENKYELKKDISDTESYSNTTPLVQIEELTKAFIRSIDKQHVFNPMRETPMTFCRSFKSDKSG